jgi:thiol-disulfide isomerase/thioredoxin
MSSSNAPPRAGRLVFALAAALSLLGCAKTERAADTRPPTKQKPAVEAPSSPQELAAGSVMPPYTATRLDGSSFDLNAERGNVVLLNIWATWCGPCRFEIPELEKLHNQYAGQRFKVIGVSVDEGENAATEVRDFMTEQKMTYPVVLDREGRVANLFQTTVLPTSALIDRTGRIVWKHVGVVSGSDREMLDALQKALRS